ncbi:MAG: F0F1 ATP synthase subunit B [Phaeodactylibacter sp.]|nr:F0F1 ATP synthase subunit B [Phaeodactylibacter sp.]
MANVLFLADFSVIKPDPGLIFWTTLIFLLVWVLLGRMAFGPIQNALKKRENDIQDALDEARNAREEMTALQSKNEELLRQAQEERAKILKEAKETKEAIVKEAKEKAQDEARKIVNSAKQDIENQRLAAMTDLKNQVGVLSIEIAEKLLRRQLDDKKDQEQFVSSLVDEIKMN